MKRTSGLTVSVSMHHGKVYSPPKFREITGVRKQAVPPHDPDGALAGALEHAVHKINLGIRMWLDLIRDYPKVREDYSGAKLAEYDGRVRMIYAMLKHHRGRYMAQFAKYMVDGCEVMARAYVKRRTTDANAARPRCSNPALRHGSSSCVVYGKGFWCKLSDAPRQPLLSSPYVILRFPIVPSRHTAEFKLNRHVIEAIATASRVGAVTLTPTTLSIAVTPRPAAAAEPGGGGIIAMDINKAEHATADTNGRQERIPNGALAHAGARRRKHAVLGVTGGPPAKKRNGRRSGRRHPAKHPGRKPSNKGRRRDRRVNRRERRAINARYANQKTDYLYKMMHGLAARGMDLVLERPTINAMLVKSNRNMSSMERDLLKMGLSQGTIVEVAGRVFAKHGLHVHLVDPRGTSSTCPVCGGTFWEANYHKDRNLWRQWRRKKACTTCHYLIDRDDAAPINLLRRRLLPSSSSDCEPAAASGNGVRVAGDWEQRVDRPVFRLVDAACVRFPHVYGEGRRLKGSAKKPLPGRTRVSLTTAWMHPSTTGRGLRAVYVSETHPLIPKDAALARTLYRNPTP